MKRLILLALLICATLASRAIPADPRPRTIKQPDGSSLTIQLIGDEHFSYYATSDRLPILLTNDGSYRYASVKNGMLTATDVVAHEPEHRTTTESAFLQFAAADIRQSVAQQWTARIKADNGNNATVNARRAPRRIGHNPSTTGNKKNLVILVNFADKKFQAENSKQVYVDMFNQKGYNENGHIGSVKDYFYDQSYGQLSIDFDVAGPYTLKRNMAYYGGNNKLTGRKDVNVGAMVQEALKAADADVNFQDYDWNGDGEIEQVFIIYAGYGEAVTGSDPNTIWPHKYELQYAAKPLTLDGMLLNTYACSCELYGIPDLGTIRFGIGVACHEFSHCLGLPDLYDTQGQANYGMGYWSVMSAGNYNGEYANMPAAYTAYERWFCDWMELTELTEATDIEDMQPITDADAREAYIIRNDAHSDEYFVLQNIQQTSWNQAALGHGMLIMHVDYDQNIWEQNTVNTSASRQRCTVVPADNNLTETYTSDIEADLYPGTSKNTAFTDNSRPAAKLYNRNSDNSRLLHKSITNISESNGRISFAFMGGLPLTAPVLQTPHILSAENSASHSFEVNWNSVDNAQSYTLELREKSHLNVQPVFTEDFAKLQAIRNAALNLSSNLNKYLSTEGWTGSYVYTGWLNNEFFGIKLGSASKPGSLLSPEFEAPSSGTISFYADVQSYSNDDLQLTVDIEDNAGHTLATATATASTTLLITADDVSTPYRIRIHTASKRAFVTAMALFDGSVTEQEASDYLSNQDASAPRRAPRQLIEGITTTSYTFSNLSADEYTLRIRANRTTTMSDWSDAVSISFLPTAILSTSSEATAEGGLVNVYTLDGRFVKTSTWHEWSLNAAPGTYIVRTTKGNIKVSIK